MAAIDIPEVHKFIEATPPFSSLSALERKQLLTGVSMLYVRQGGCYRAFDSSWRV